MRPCPIRLGHIHLRVRNLQDSTTFYCEVLGLVRVSTPGDRDHVRLAFAGADDRYVLVLTPGLPSGAELLGVDHFAFEVPTTAHVHGVYHKAKVAGAPAVGPRFYDGHWQAYIFDPDGHKVEVMTLDPAAFDDKEVADARVDRPTHDLRGSGDAPWARSGLVLGDTGS